MNFHKYVATNPTIEDMRSKVFIMSGEDHTDFTALMNSVRSNHHVVPQLLTDGTYAVNADVVSEIHEGGILHDRFAILSEGRLTNSQVVLRDDIEHLFPQPEEIS